MPDILYTPRYEEDLVRIYKYSARKWGRLVAERTLSQINEVEKRALAHPDFGKVNEHSHSALYRYATTPNSQTVFFHRIKEDVIMITVGYSGRGWPHVLKRIESQIQTFINQIQSKENKFLSRQKDKPSKNI